MTDLKIDMDEPGAPEKEGGKWGLQFHREDRCDEDRANAFAAEILDIVLPLGGDYDGWGAVIEKPRSNGSTPGSAH